MRKLLQTKIPGTIMKFIANYNKGRKVYITYIHHTFSHRQFKTGVPQGRVLSPTLFNINSANILPPRAPVQVMTYIDDITITFTQSSTRKYIQTNLHNPFAGTKQNNLTLDPYKTTCTLFTLFTPDPAEYISNLDLIINNTALPMVTHPDILGLTLDPNLIYSTHIHKISVHTHTNLYKS